MNVFVKGMVIAVVQVCIVAGLGAKLLYDRATLPRVWADAVPYDPYLPVRGRYVSLQVVVGLEGDRGDIRGGHGQKPPQSFVLRVKNNRLIAEAGQKETAGHFNIHVRYVDLAGEKVAVVAEPLAFFIPEHVPDPTRRQAGERLCVEVTVPKKGVPRPIKLGVRKGDGPIEPLDLR